MEYLCLLSITKSPCYLQSRKSLFFILFGKNGAEFEKEKYSTSNNTHMRSEFKKRQQIHIDTHKKHSNKCCDLLFSRCFFLFSVRCILVRIIPHVALLKLIPAPHIFQLIYFFSFALHAESSAFFSLVPFTVCPNYLLSILKREISFGIALILPLQMHKFSPLKSGKCREKKANEIERKKGNKGEKANKNCLLYIFTCLPLRMEQI